MRALYLVAPAALLAVSAIQEGGHDVSSEALTRRFRQRCMTCHQPPDLRFEVDRAWLKQVHDTAWEGTSKRARAALVELLSGEPLPLPTVVAAPPEGRPEGAGFVAPGFERGALLLRDAERRVWRLSWEDEAGGDRRRALPAGRYELIGYRIVRASGEDVWHVSASAPSIETVKIPEGATKELDLDPSIRVGIEKRGRRLAVAVRGHERAGLSIYRNGARIPLGWAASAAAGALLAEGPVEYG